MPSPKIKKEARRGVPLTRGNTENTLNRGVKLLIRAGISTLREISFLYDFGITLDLYKNVSK